MSRPVRRGFSALAFLLLAFNAVAETPGKASGSQGWLGIGLGEAARASGDKEPAEGVGLMVVFAGSPAQRAGLRARDRILAVDGQTVTTAGQTIQLIRSKEPSGWVTLSLRRGKRALELRAFLESKPADSSSLKMLEGWIGVQAIDLPPSLREFFGAPRESGVLISAVVADSPAEAAGLSIGDVVFDIDGEPVPSAGALSELVRGAGVENRVAIRVMRQGSELTVEPAIGFRPEKPPEPYKE